MLGEPARIADGQPDWQCSDQPRLDGALGSPSVESCIGRIETIHRALLDRQLTDLPDLNLSLCRHQIINWRDGSSHEGRSTQGN